MDLKKPFRHLFRMRQCRRIMEEGAIPLEKEACNGPEVAFRSLRKDLGELRDEGGHHRHEVRPMGDRAVGRTGGPKMGRIPAKSRPKRRFSARIRGLRPDSSWLRREKVEFCQRRSLGVALTWACKLESGWFRDRNHLPRGELELPEPLFPCSRYFQVIRRAYV